MEEQLAATLPDEAAGGRLVMTVDARRHPNLLAALPYIPAPHPEEHFEHGLRLIISGIHASLG